MDAFGALVGNVAAAAEAHSDRAVILGSMALLMAARLVSDAVFVRLGRALGVRGAETFAEHWFKLLVMVPLSAWGIAMSLRYELFPTVDNCFVGLAGQSLPADVRLRYLFGLGWYAYATVTTLAYDHAARAGDGVDLPLLAHHVVTFALMWASYYAGLHRIGVVVLALHDVGDVAVNVSQLVAVNLDAHIAVQAAAYVALLMSWFGTRIYVFPVYVIRSTLAAGALIRDESYGTLLVGCNACLLFLLVLHVYWFAKILRIGYRILAGTTDQTSRDKADARQRKKHA